MQRLVFFVLAVLSCWYGMNCKKQNTATLEALPFEWPKANQKRTDYINTWKVTAVKLSQKDGIPASIRMAQAILESSDGSSTLAQRGNHFGIKCFQDHAHAWSRSCTPGEDGYYRAYSSASDSWKHHARALRDKRYASLHGEEYPGWAIGLQQLGYAADTAYPKKLTALIERHELHRLDHQPHKPSTLFISIGIVLGLLALFLPSSSPNTPQSSRRRH